MTSAVYTGRWLEPAKRLADQSSEALATRLVGLPRNMGTGEGRNRQRVGIASGRTAMLSGCGGRGPRR
jgi:hypothetical protein